MFETHKLCRQAEIAEIDRVSSGLKKTINTAVSERRYPVYLWGEPGTGKTCCMAALCKKYWKQAEEDYAKKLEQIEQRRADSLGKPDNREDFALSAKNVVNSADYIYWLNFSHFCNAIKTARNIKTRTCPARNKNGTVDHLSEAAIWERIEKALVVFVDEIACDKQNETNSQILRFLLDYRYMRPLFMTANMTLEQIATFFDSRCTDRLSQGTEILLQVSGGRSLRQQQGKRMKVVV